MQRLLLVCAIFACVSATAHAQSAPEREAYDPSRTLDGHAFIPFSYIPFPFVTKQVSSRTGIGISDLDVLGIVNVGEQKTVTISEGNITDNAKLVAFSEAFDLAFMLTRWLGLTADFGFANAVGVNESGAFNAGINYLVGGNLGLVFRLAERRNWYLSFRVDGSALALGAVVPVELAEGVTVVNGQPEFNVASLAVTGNRFGGTGYALFALNPSSWLGIKRKSVLGLQGSTGLQLFRNEIESVSIRQLNLDFGVGASARFNELGVPLALLLGGQMNVRLNTEGNGVPTTALAPAGKTTGSIEGGVFYSDPKYVDVGGSISVQLSDTEHRTVLRLIINHFW